MVFFNEDYKLNTFFSGKDVYFNFDKWRSGEINKCLILGLSGSGKTSLAHKIADQYNCDVVHLDMFRGQVYYNDEVLKTDHRQIYEYFTHIWTHGNRMVVKTMPSDIRNEEFEKMVYWLLDRPEPLIIEGMLENIISNNEQLQKFPIIFKGTSVVKSMYRAAMRELNRTESHNGIIPTLCWLTNHLTKYPGKFSDRQNFVRDIVYKANGDTYEELQEGFLPDLTFYHGSNRKFNKLEPNCFDAGNRLQSTPRWGAYMFKDKHLAFIWAIVRVVDTVCEKAMMDKTFVKSSTSNETLYGYPYSKDIFGFDVTFRLIIKNKVYDEIRDICDGEKFYVYTLNVPIDTRLSFGTTDTLPEYTVDYSPDIVKVEEYTLTKEMFEEYFERVTDKQFAEIKKGKPHRNNVRGILGFFLYDMERRGKMRKLVAQKLKAGELQIGGDLGFLGEHYTSFNTTTNIFPLTHEQMGEIYTKKALTESNSLCIHHKSGNITQYCEGAYFNEEVGVWMRRPNEEELVKLNKHSLQENFQVNMEFLNNEYE